MNQTEDRKETFLEEVVYKSKTQNHASETLKPEKPKTGTCFLYFSAAVANLVGFVTGLSFGWTSPVLPKLSNGTDLENNPIGRPITQSEEAWIAGLLCLGSIFGPIVTGAMANKIGRKRTLLVIACPMAVSFVIKAFANNVPLFYFARLVLGIGTGGVFMTLPMYLAEIAEDHNRGTLGCSMGVFIGSGLLSAFLIGPFLSIRIFSLVCTIPLIIFFSVFTIYIPETPQFLALVNDRVGLEASLSKLRHKNFEEIQAEADDIARSVRATSGAKPRIRDLFTSEASRKGLIICAGLILAPQFVGVNVVIAYMQTIFEATGSGLSPAVSTILVGIIQVVSVAATSAIVDRLGRRVLLLVSSIGVSLSLVGLGLFFHLKARQFQVDSISWLPVSSLLAYVVTFNIGFGPIPWAVMAELFPPNIRGLRATITTIICFTAATVITLLFPSLARLLGMAKSFWLFALFGVTSTFFIYWVLPETKGKSWQEIQKLLVKRKN